MILTEFDLYKFLIIFTLLFSISDSFSGLKYFLLFAALIIGGTIFHSEKEYWYVNEKIKRIIRVYLFLSLVGTMIQLLGGITPMEWLSGSFNILSKVSMGMFFLLLLSNSMREDNFWIDVISLIVLFFGLYCIIKEIQIGISNDRVSALGYVSKNFTAAIGYIPIPYFLYYINESEERFVKLKCLVSLIIGLVMVAISASRTAFVVVLFIGFYELIYLVKSFKIFSHIQLVLLSILAAIIIPIIIQGRKSRNIQEMFGRMVTAFNNNNDEGSRGVLRELGLNMFSSGNFNNKLFGIGNINLAQGRFLPPHCFPIELLLAFGFFGLIIYLFSVLMICKTLYEECGKTGKHYILETVSVSVLTMAVQPFFSTSYICNILLFVPLLSICFYENKVQLPS